MTEKKTGDKKLPEITGEAEVPVKTGVKESTVTLIFRHNRTFELYVGRKVFRFHGREPVNVPEWVINHKDFQHQRHYFNIKGLNKKSGGKK